MLKFSLRDFMLQRGISTPLTFLVNIGVGRTTASRLLNNRVSKLDFVMLRKICVALHCTPSDLFIWKEDPNNPLPEKHPLLKLQRPPLQPIISRLQHLTPAQIQKLNTLIDRLEDDPTL